jgi:hypothetical protein
MIAANTIDASIAINALKNAGINTAGMNADALGERLGQLYPDETFKVVGYTPTQVTESTPASGGLKTLGSDAAIDALRNRGVNPAGMSEAQVVAALQSFYPGENFKIVGYTPVPTSTTGGTTGGGNPLTAYGPPASLAPPTGGTTTGTTTGGTTGGTTLAPFPTTVTPPNINPFMTPGVTFPPRTQFNQQASAPLNISQQGNTYGAPTPVKQIFTQPTQFASVQPGGAIGAVPTFQNPFTTPALVPTSTSTSFNTIGADIARNALLSKGFTQANVSGMNANQLATEMGRISPGESFKIVNFADGGLTGTNNMASTTGMVPQFQNPFGPQQPPAGMNMYNQGQQPQQHQSISVGGTPQQPGLPGLLPVGSQNQYPQGYTPIGQQPQNFLSLNVPRN